MKRRIAAVLMADAAGMTRALAENEPSALARLAEYQSIIADIVNAGGGRNLAPEGEDMLAEFQSAVQAVRSAVEVQETLRARNRALGLAERLEFKLAVTIGEVVDGKTVAPETLASAAHLVALAAPGGLCISQSVRESVTNKLAIKFQDLTVEGEKPDQDTQATYRVALDRPTATGGRRAARSAGRKTGVGISGAALAGLAGLAVGAAAVVVATWETPQPEPPAVASQPAAAPPPAAPPVATGPAPQAPQAAVPAPAPAAKAVPGKIEFLPSKAPDPSTVLTAKRLLPKAWKDCQLPDAATAAAACKTLLDSGLPKEAELAAVQLRYGKALRAQNRLSEAIDALTASIAAAPSTAAYTERGTAHFDRGGFAEAIADYTDAIKLDPANGEAFNNRAWTHFQSGKPDQALPDADAAVRLLGREAFVWDTRAHINAKLGNRDAAISDFRAALAIDPTNAASKAGLASLGVN